MSVFAVVTIFVVGMLVTVGKFVGRPMAKLVDMLEQYDVDLTLEMPIQTKDEIGQVGRLLNRFVNKLNLVVGQAQEAAKVVGEHVGGQAAAIEQLTTSSADIAGTTKVNSDNSRKAAELMNQVSEKVGRANTSIASLNESMVELSESSKRVADIMKAIDDIAFQTNLLALNAAVEAARAGKPGRVSRSSPKKYGLWPSGPPRPPETPPN
jgi:methyl-accepting chemotaxis protein